MGAPRLTKLEFQVMEALSGQGRHGRRDVDSRDSGLRCRAAQTSVHDDSDDGVSHGSQGRGKARAKGGNFHLFAAAISRDSAQHRMIDDLLA